VYHASDEDDFRKIVELWCVASLVVAISLNEQSNFRTLCSGDPGPYRRRISGDEEEGILFNVKLTLTKKPKRH
jgi:hypothetical protein